MDFKLLISMDVYDIKQLFAVHRHITEEAVELSNSAIENYTVKTGYLLFTRTFERVSDIGNAPQLLYQDIENCVFSQDFVLKSRHCQE